MRSGIRTVSNSLRGRGASRRIQNGTRMDETTRLDRYGQVLADYLEAPGEEALYAASLLSRDLVHRGVGPEETVALHVEALEQALAGRPPASRSAAWATATSSCSRSCFGAGGGRAPVPRGAQGHARGGDARRAHRPRRGAACL